MLLLATAHISLHSPLLTHIVPCGEPAQYQGLCVWLLACVHHIAKDPQLLGAGSTVGQSLLTSCGACSYWGAHLKKSQYWGALLGP